MTRILTLLTTFALLGGLAAAQNAEPPSNYVAASDILPLPEFIPGAGALYIDPANAPVGPWLAYGKNGELVELLYMVPLSQLDAAGSWEALGAGVVASLGVSIDHLDITFNGGHPGMAEPHYHLRLALIDHAGQQAALGE